MKHVIVILNILIAGHCSLATASLFDLFGVSITRPESSPPKVRVPFALSEKREQLELSRTQLTEAEKELAEFLPKSQAELEQITAQISTVKKALKNATGVEENYYNAEVQFLNELHQTVFNDQLSRKENIALTQQLIKTLEELLKDPEFKQLGIQTKAVYRFQDFQEGLKKLATHEERLKLLIEQKNDATTDLENRKRRLIALNKEHQEKKRLQEEFSVKASTVGNVPDENGFDVTQQGRLLDLEEKYIKYEKELYGSKIKELNRKIALLDTQISIETEKIKLLKAGLQRIKGSLRIEQQDLTTAQQHFEEAKKESLIRRDAYYEMIKQLTVQRETALKEIEALKKRLTTSAITSSNIDWTMQPQTMDAYQYLAEVGLKHEQIALLDTKIEVLRATIELEKTQLKQEEVAVSMLQTWYNITRRMYRSNEALHAEAKKYQLLMTEAMRDESVVKEKRNNIANQLTGQNSTLVAIRALTADLKPQRDGVFKGQSSKYAFVLAKLLQAERVVNERIETSNTLIKTYGILGTALNSLTSDISTIVNELETKSIWQRSEYAISLQGIRNIPHDINVFFSDIKELAAHFFSVIEQNALTFLTRFKQHPFDLIELLLKITVLIFCYWLLRALLATSAYRFDNANPLNRGLLSFYRLVAALFHFLHHHSLIVYIFLVLFLLIGIDSISDRFLQVVIYLASIGYFLFLMVRFIGYVETINETPEKQIYAPGFDKRFKFVFSLLTGATIALLLGRQAFMAATYHASELPIILLASYSLIIRTLIIFSIGKDELLSFIPTEGTLWQALTDIIDRYYYPLLILIILLMIISDPYVGGYGNLVSYIMWGIIGTAVVIKGLLIFQLWIRTKASQLFFSQTDDGLRERFTNAKTWYGLFVILLFMFSVSMGVILTMRLWGKQLTVKDIMYALNYEMLSTGYDTTTGQHVWLTPLKIITMLSFVLCGSMLAFAINRFVLRRIFELLPVDLGVQNTVSSILRYLFILASILLAFLWGGLGTFLIAIGVVIGSIGYIVKEPISDFISYFIILVQRPIKIGDFITMGELFGVVRHITPRSVIIRTKNSYSIIVPNSSIINQPVHNWNYTRGFVAFDDITFTVPYSIDPLKVRAIVTEVLDSNPDLLKTPRPILRLEDFSENGYAFMIRGFISSNRTLDMWDIASDVRFALVQAFRAHDIAIAVPTRVLVTRSPNPDLRHHDQAKEN
jgi:small-conductance mechanosensitive channel